MTDGLTLGCAHALFELKPLGDKIERASAVDPITWKLCFIVTHGAFHCDAWHVRRARWMTLCGGMLRSPTLFNGLHCFGKYEVLLKKICQPFCCLFAGFLIMH